MTTSKVIGYFAAWQPEEQQAQAIINMIQELKIKGAARQATADSAMLHMITLQEMRG